LLKKFLRLDNKKSGVDTAPKGPGAGVLKLCPEGLFGSIKRDASINFIEGSFDWKLKVLIHFLRVKRDRRVTSHTLRLFL
jgi:hypothetical protein